MSVGPIVNDRDDPAEPPPRLSSLLGVPDEDGLTQTPLRRDIQLATFAHVPPARSRPQHACLLHAERRSSSTLGAPETRPTPIRWRRKGPRRSISCSSG